MRKWRESKWVTLRDDFGELDRYREANATLKPPAMGETRVIFFGDSITDLWKLDEYFRDKPYINRGIGGQTTPQMLVRFRPGSMWFFRPCFRCTTTHRSHRTCSRSVRQKRFCDLIAG